MKNKERVVIFIDGSNFYHSLKETFDLHDNQINFKELIEKLKGNKLLVSVYYYNASLDRGYNEEVYWKQQKFFSELKKIPGFNVILCNMRKIIKGKKKPEFTVKGDDICLATDMISLAYENVYDITILVSGDGDFVPAIKKIQKLGKKVENIYFKISRSSFLKNVCDSSLCLDDFISDFLKGKNSPVSPRDKP